MNARIAVGGKRASGPGDSSGDVCFFFFGLDNVSPPSHKGEEGDF